MRGSTQSPALISYVYNRWGTAAVETTWRDGTRGLTRHTDMTLGTILQDWRSQLLSTDYVRPPADWHDVMMDGCSP